MTQAPCRPYLPPEWAPQDGVMLTWPHTQGDWAHHLADAERTFANLAREIGRHERVLIVCYDEVHRSRVQDLLTAAGVDPARTELRIAPSNDSWARDHGPITVLCSGQAQLLDFRFNGWGGKYPADLDNAITPALFRNGAFGDTPLESVDLVLEGGGIEVDGSGTLLATRPCLMSPKRNPGLTPDRMEQLLAEHLGIERFLWLEHGWLAGDDTDGHIDTLARFCDRETIAYVHCGDREDEHYEPLSAMEAELQQFVSAAGTPYRLVPLPLPGARFDDAGQRLPATYANFLIINDAVLVPTYADPMDAVALERLRPCFPDRELVTIDALPLIRQYGSLHCVTMQLPAGVMADRS
jgi:agmatine deiminase